MGWRFSSTRIFCLVEIGFILFWIGDHSSSQKSLRGVERDGWQKTEMILGDQ
jgi:hypothetical protein